MIYNDFIKEKDGFFTTYKKLFPDKYSTLYGDKTPEQLDNNFLMKNSQKVLTSFFIDKSIDWIVTFIDSMTFDKNVKLKNLLEITYEIKDGRKETIKETVTTQGTYTNTSQQENIENTFGFDSETAVKDNSSNLQNSGENITDLTVSKTYEKNITDKSLQEIIDSEIERNNKQSFTLLTFDNFCNILFLDIYA